MAATNATGDHTLMKLERRALQPKDVAIKVLYCGICHSDIHTIRQDWGPIKYPQITGHELAGEVVAVGSSVSKFKVGSKVGVGCMVNSCRHCDPCTNGFEQYCENGSVSTYAAEDRDGSITQGGYSTLNVVDEDFVIRIPDQIDLAEAGPMMCAGITVYSPLRHWSVGPGQKIAIVGMGGLGHMGVKIATAMGAEVTVITTTKDKTEDAIRFGAKNVILNEDATDFSKYKRSFDFMLDTIPYQHDIEKLLPMLKMNSTLCIVGIGKVTEPHQVGPFSLLKSRSSLSSSGIGGIRETQELIDFCALHKIKPEIKKIPMTQIDAAWKNIFDKKARYRFVIDMKM
ncbi:MAG: NAD(P)-dependent alcohol dehydrogenase [Bdellovibrio sp.]|nr:NAD(P)-dependent alcohol dehydrogenase [Bdellovibrio sp.]